MRVSGMHVPKCGCGGHKINCQVSSTMWILGIKLISSGLVENEQY